MAERCQDVVIGGGAIGVSCAEALATAGRDVVLLEQHAMASGCSHGNAGWVTPCHSLPIPGPGLVRQSLRWMLRSDSPLYIKPSLRPSLLGWLWRFYRHCNEKRQRQGLAAVAALNRDVVSMTGDLVERYSLDCEYQPRGLHYAFLSEPGFQKGRRECRLLNEHEIPGEELSAEELLAREPALTRDVVGGVFYPAEADFVPDRFVEQLAAQLPGLGVDVRTGCRVTGWRLSGRKIEQIETAGGPLVPETVILAAGAWTGRLARQLGIRLPMEPAKGYSITLDPQAGLPTRPLNVSESKFGVTPWEGGVRLAGTLELAGLQREINQARVEAIVRSAREALPGFSATGVQEVWTGMRPLAADGLPIIGKSLRCSNLVMATAHGMLGLTQAAITGRLVSDITTGRSPTLDPVPFSPDRF